MDFLNILGSSSIDFGDLDLSSDIHYRGEAVVDVDNVLYHEVKQEFDELERSVEFAETDEASLQAFRTAIVRQRDALLKKLSQPKTPESVKLLDKVAFNVGVWNLVLTAFIGGAHPDIMPLWFTLKAVVLISLRAVLYRKTNNHYFLFDFCYMTNCLILLYLWVFPQSMLLFNVCFSFSLGPLLWAVPTWRNSLVFHSVDKMTSLFIHLGPPAVLWNIRWHLNKGANGGRFNICSDHQCSMSFYEASVFPLFVYMGWQVLYVIRVVLLGKKDRTTSFSYSMRNEQSFTFNFCNLFGPSFRLPMFMLLQLAFTFATMLPVKYLYASKIGHLLAYYLAFGVATWNGSNYYFEIFVKRYEKQLSQKKSE